MLKFSTIQHDTRLEDTTVESIFKDFLTDCRDNFGGEGCPPDVTIVLKGGTVVDPPPVLGGEWLTEAKRRDKSSRDEEWRARQHKIRSRQAKDFERLNDALNPVWPLDVEGVPSAASVSNDDSSVDSVLGFDDLSVDSGSTSDNDPEGASFYTSLLLPRRHLTSFLLVDLLDSGSSRIDRGISRIDRGSSKGS